LQTSKQIFELEKREQRAQDVTVKLASTTMHGYNFNVYDKEDKIKYFGEISQDHTHDECGCQSFYHGNSENYQKTNPLPFSCKHIISAHNLMENFW